MTEKNKNCVIKHLAMLPVALLFVCLLTLPAFALGEANITPETTMGELRANESLLASGFNSYDKGMLWPEGDVWHANETLGSYVGDTAADAAAGLNLIIENYNAGVQVTHKIYTAEEIAADPSKDEVEIYYFPAKTAGAKYAIVLPGNMSERSAKVKEGCGTASQLHELGYAVFILRYSVWQDNKDSAVIDDIAKAVEYITANADTLGVQAEDYAIVGFSAGGQMAGVFGTDSMGYKNYGVLKPGALLLAYPINDYKYVGTALYLAQDCASDGEKYYNLVLSDNITPDYPSTYHWFGKKDITLHMIDFKSQGYKLEEALAANNVYHKLVIYENAGHAVGTGTGTDAEGWLEDAAAFWEDAVAAAHQADN